MIKMPETAPQYLPTPSPEPPPQTADLDEHICKIDQDLIRQKHEELLKQKAEIDLKEEIQQENQNIRQQMAEKDFQKTERRESQPYWLNNLDDLVEKAKSELPVNPYNHEIGEIRAQILSRAENIIATVKHFLHLSRMSTNNISDQASNEQFKNNPLVEWLCDDSGPVSTVEYLDRILYKQPVKEAEFESWPKDKQELWERYAEDFKKAQSEAREWFEENQRLKLSRPHKDDFFDGVLYDFDPEQTVLLDKDSPNYNPKNYIYQTIRPCMQFRYRIIKKGFVQLAKLRK